MSVHKKLLPFKGLDPDRSKIVIDNKAIEQVSYFNCTGNLIPYERELDIDNTFNNCVNVTGFISSVRPQ